jgi:hypothetical protein
VVSLRLVRPGGDPDLLEQPTAQPESAVGADNLAGSTRRITTGVRSATEWTGDGSKAYLAFTGNPTYGVTVTPVALTRITAARTRICRFPAVRAAEGRA